MGSMQWGECNGEHGMGSMQWGVCVMHSDGRTGAFPSSECSRQVLGPRTRAGSLSPNGRGVLSLTPPSTCVTGEAREGEGEGERERERERAWLG